MERKLYSKVRFVQDCDDDYNRIDVVFSGLRDGYCEANSQPVIDYLSEWDGGETMSYMHIGQHGGTDYHGVIRKTKPATENQYQPLLNELKSIGYDNLEVRQKSQIKWQ